jgi:hypothetical protein
MTKTKGEIIMKRLQIIAERLSKLGFKSITLNPTITYSNELNVNPCLIMYFSIDNKLNGKISKKYNIPQKEVLSRILFMTLINLDVKDVSVFDKEMVLQRLMEKNGVKSYEASDNASKIEHTLSTIVYTAIADI